MNRAALLALHQYNSFANRLVWDTAAKLSTAQYTGDSSPSHGSVQELLYHMFECETFFLLLCQDKTIESSADDTDLPALDALVFIWEELFAARRAYLESASEEELAEVIPSPIAGKTFQLARWQLIAQSLLHSGHHRGELSIVMTGLGYPLPTLDAILHFMKASGQEWNVK